MGTPAYMPPEQALGQADRIDPRADVFALGAILCEILTGRPPYTGAFPDVCLMAAAGELADACQRLDACGADASLRELARRCLASERDMRPADAGVVAQDLASYLVSAQEQLRQAQLERAAAEARTQEARAKAKAERRARRLTLALAAAAAVLAAAAGFGWLQYDRFQQAQAARTAAVDGKIEAALAEADDRLNRNDWSGAAAAATRARELHASEASVRWDERMNKTQADVELVTRLDEARLVQTEFDAATRSFHREKAMPQFAEAFARYGIRVGCDPAEAAARLARRPAAVQRAAAGALENWWLLALNRDAGTRDWLGAMLQAAAADEWQARLRRAVANSDRRALEELAAPDDAPRQPPDSLTALANALEHFQDHDAVIALLRPAQRMHPDDFWINLELAHALNRRGPSGNAEAFRFLSAAWALRPANVDYVYLGWNLIRQEDWDGVVFASRKAIDLRPDNGQAYNQLGVGLEAKGQWEQAEAAYRKAVELKPEDALYHCNLGRLLDRRGRKDEADAAYESAARLAPEDAENRFNLGQFHWRRKEFNAALKEYDKAIALDPAFAKAYFSRGDALAELGRMDDAIAAYQTAVRLNPTDDKLLSNLGIAWKDKGDFERAVSACSRAVELNPKSAANQSNLGLAFDGAGDRGGAVTAFREAIRLDPGAAEAHCNLGLALQEQGLFAEALAEIEHGRQLGSRRTDWGYPTDQWLVQARRFVELDAKLPDLLEDGEKPASPGEQLDYAVVCKLKGLYGASARLYAGAFTAEPALAASLAAGNRYCAACVAAQAGCGQGRDAPEPDAAVRARWRKQALDWLRADLALWAAAPIASRDDRLRAAAALRRWRGEKALAGIREPEELAKLPESERGECIRFWADVQELLARRLAKAPGE
jgi:serine/threonine-protein kinase